METVEVYVAPVTEVVDLRIENSILVGSEQNNGSGENFSWD